MNTPTAAKELWVKYSVVDGAHFFTGANTYSVGLCVAHKDLKTAFDEVSIQLKNLLEINYGIHTNIVPAVPFEEFKAYIAQTPPKSKIQPTVPFELELEAA